MGHLLPLHQHPPSSSEQVLGSTFLQGGVVGQDGFLPEISAGYAKGSTNREEVHPGSTRGQLLGPQKPILEIRQRVVDNPLDLGSVPNESLHNHLRGLRGRWKPGGLCTLPSQVQPPSGTKIVALSALSKRGVISKDRANSTPIPIDCGEPFSDEAEVVVDRAGVRSGFGLQPMLELCQRVHL